MAIIEFENVSFSYDGTHNALDGISLSIETGSFVCVLGGNGSGKSTLARHVNALLTPDAGRVCVLDHDTSDPSSVLFVRSHAGMVFQNPDDQLVASIIEDDVAFGPENLGIEPAELRRRVDAALGQVGLQGFQKKQTDALSGGQKQRVAIAGALAMKPSILVLDEAGAMLDPRGRRGLLRVCRELNDQGLTIVLITHFMEEAAIADRVIVLDKGTVALDGAPEDVLLQAGRLAELSLDVPFATRLSAALRDRGVPIGMHADEAALERELAQAGPSDDLESGGWPKRPALGKAGREAACADGPAHGGDQRIAPSSTLGQTPRPVAGDEDPWAYEPPAIELQGVSFTYEPLSKKRRFGRSRTRKSDVEKADWGRSPDEFWAVKDLTVAIRTREMFGIAGHTGSGKSTLIQLICGLLKPNEGTVHLHGHDLAGKNAAEAARLGTGVVFQYPERQLFAATVFDDVAFGPRNLGRTSAEIEQDVRRAMQMVHLDIDELHDRSPFALSGGQQRRIAIAGVLAMRPKTLVLDEPVAGLDPQSKRWLLELLRELHDDVGLTMAIVSHNMDDLAALCDRVLVLNEGRAFALGTPAEVFADEEHLKSVGLGVPQAAHLANRLSAAGMPLPVGTLPTIDELADAIAEHPAWHREGR